MSGFVEYPAPELRATVVPVSELWFSLTVSLVTVTGVVWALEATPASTKDIALPVFVLGAGAMLGLGLADIARGRELRFARALIISGLLWSLSALTASREPLASSVGHVSQWCADLAIAYLLLSYPSGRLAVRTDRALFVAGALLVGLLFLPTALVGQFPHPSPWSMCAMACPRNTFSLTHSTPSLVSDVVVPLRELLTAALFAAIAMAVIRRARSAEQLLGQLYMPIAAFAVLQTAIFVVYFPLRGVAPHSDAVSVMGWIFVLSLPGAAVACSTGRMYEHIHAANALDRLARDLRASTSAGDVRRALADALHDQSLQILHSFPGDSRAWVDETGSPSQLPRPEAVQRVTQVSSGSWRIAVLHDASLAENRPLVLSAGSYALAALENHRLIGELGDSLRDLEEIRASRFTAEQDARQKIERDLHDGAQQRLVALRVKLGLVAARLADRDPAGAEALRALEGDVDATIDEVRSLARGIYPPQLARTGLREALRATSRSAALPTTVRADRLGRYPAEIETTVYFSCCEALQNAAKHARAATGVTISVWQDRELHFEVRDDGTGFDLQTTPYGTGLRNLNNRLTAVGGTMTMRSVPGQGTVLGGSIPLA